MQFAVIGLNHGHIYQQVDGLLAAGAVCVGFHAEEAELCAAFAKKYPAVPWRERAALLADPSIDLIASASINADRGPLGVQALYSGKHFFADKPPLTRLQDVEAIARALEKSGKLMFVFYGERMNSPLDIKAKQLVDSGVLGDLVHLMGLGPHLLRPETRPPWMFDPDRYGGVLNDIASHQLEWFVWLTGERIKYFSSRVGRFGAAEGRTLDDFGDATLTAASGVTGYVRVDWFTPRQSPIWGDIRGVIVGTQGTLELRRTYNMSAQDPADRGPHMLLITNTAAPQRVDASTCTITWPQDILRSIAAGKNELIDHATLLHVMEMSVRLQTQAVRVR